MTLTNEKLWITGLVSAVFTPMHPDGSLNLERVGAIVDHLIQEGVNGLYVCGSTGEGPLLTAQERCAVAEAFVNAADGRVPVIIQVGHNSLHEARALARHAQAIGADAISAIPPSYFKVESLDLLLECLLVITEGAPELPFYYYHIPRLTSTNLDIVELLQKGGERLPSLHGVKYSDFTVFEMQACTAVAEGKYNVLFGSDEMLLSGLVSGAHGAVGSTYNFAAPLYSRVISAYQNGELGAAQEAQALAVKMVRAMNRHSPHSNSLPSLKAMMKFLDLDCGPTRLPLLGLSDRQFDGLRQELDEMGFFDWGRH